MQSLFPSESTESQSYGPEFTEYSQPDAWTAIKENLATKLEASEFESWFRPLDADVISDHEIVVNIPNPIFYQELVQYIPLIEGVKTELGLADTLIRFEVTGSDVEIAKREIDQPPIEPSDNFVKSEEQKQTPGFSKSLSPSGRLNSNYTFESFVRGPSNQFALATCLSVADNPGHNYNPLFIYGSTGLGKTHLLHAVGHRVRELFPDAVVTYISSERFMNEMIYCIRFNKMWDFRQKYRHCDVFLVDDIQFISGKKATQEEFFHTFNTLYEAKKQIVITSDLFPQDIPDIEDRLRNRFQWGLIADIQTPDVEHRIAILHNKATQLGVSLGDEVADYIATHAKRNIRELEGALHRLAAFASLHGRKINRELAVETFQNVLGEPPKQVTIELIQKLVAEHFKIRVADLKSKKRQRALTLPRQIAMFLSRQMTTSSFPEIGTRFGGKDHTTVMHAVKKIDLDRTKDLDLRAHLESLERRLEQVS